MKRYYPGFFSKLAHRQHMCLFTMFHQVVQENQQLEVTGLANYWEMHCSVCTTGVCFLLFPFSPHYPYKCSNKPKASLLHKNGFPSKFLSVGILDFSYNSCRIWKILIKDMYPCWDGVEGSRKKRCGNRQC